MPSRQDLPDRSAENEAIVEPVIPGDYSPADIYSRKLEVLRAKQNAGQRREKQFGFAKLATGCVFILMAALFMRRPAALTLLLIPVAIFVVLAVFHERLLRSLRSRARTIAYYEHGLARVSGTWQGTGESGENFLDPMHPYARDLDLFGKASLFELLCTARTRAGESTLAKWLLDAAPVGEIRARQKAISELKDKPDFRERLFSLGETVRLGVQPEKLSAWGEHPPILRTRTIRILTTAFSVLWVASLVSWGVWGWTAFPVLMSILNLGYSHHLHSRLDESADEIEKAAADLKLLADVLQLLEREAFTSPKLTELQEALKRDNTVPSEAVRKLSRLVEWLESRHNPYARFLDIFTFWIAQVVFLAEDWQKRFGPAIRGWLESAGEAEALTALAGFAWEHPDYVFPQLIETAGSAAFDAEGLAHPLLPASGAVPNDLKLGSGDTARQPGTIPQLVILSGPNMAGKSTFIRSIGINAVLAQCGAPVRARRLVLSPLAVAASICVLDSLNGGTSRFYTEIRRVKLIADLAEQQVPVLFLLDELLSGTNSHDRLAGTKLVVDHLIRQGAIGIVSTHDLALTQIPEAPGMHAVNCHFEDRLENGELHFDYRLKPGIVRTSNALQLMRSIGLGIES
ncbi:MutS-related protein [Paracidobacterium acidisoli]|nr:DNA mismatch repair protein MutS [Paracidobacterium acidisoli]MBT9329693.1 mismatch repair protein [Paracidobacterium acidisoli]